MILCKWTITSNTKLSDADAIMAYEAVYQLPLGSTHHQAIQALFMMHYPQAEVGDMEP
jgi:hypothetical protein